MAKYICQLPYKQNALDTPFIHYSNENEQLYIFIYLS